MTDEQTETTNSRPAKTSLLKRIFYGPDGLRIIWGVLLFILLVAILGTIIYLVLSYIMPTSAKQMAVMEPGRFGISELSLAIVVAIATWLMALIEHRRFMAYNLAANNKLPRFLAGAFWGFVSLSFLVFLLWVSGFLVFKGFSLNIVDALHYGIEWFAVFIVVAFFEETIFRGYLLYTLTRSMGFWRAAILLSVIFALAHMLNGGETFSGLVSVFVSGMLFCTGIWYTKSLWWSIGFHAAWDWAQSYFYGTPDSAMLVSGHLLNTQPAGSAFWSGGTDGPEGSILFFPVLLLTILCMWLWWRKKKPATV